MSSCTRTMMENKCYVYYQYMGNIVSNKQTVNNNTEFSRVMIIFLAHLPMGTVWTQTDCSDAVWRSTGSGYWLQASRRCVSKIIRIRLHRHNIIVLPRLYLVLYLLLPRPNSDSIVIIIVIIHYFYFLKLIPRNEFTPFYSTRHSSSLVCITSLTHPVQEALLGPTRTDK